MRQYLLIILLPLVAFTCSQGQVPNAFVEPAAITKPAKPKVVVKYRRTATTPPSKTEFKKPTAVSGQKIKVMIIDTGVAPHYMIKPYLPKEHEIDQKDYPLDQSYCSGERYCSHGTHIAGIILFGDQNRKSEPACGEVEIYSCNFYSDKDNIIADTTKCFERALKMDVDFVNYSAGGEGSTEEESNSLKMLSARGIKVVVAAGNEKSDLDTKPYYPAIYSEDPEFDNLIPVANMEYNGIKAVTSNYTGGIVFDYGTDIKSTSGTDNFEYQTGTSQAAAMYTHRLVMKRCKQIHSLSDKLPDQ